MKLNKTDLLHAGAYDEGESLLQISQVQGEKEKTRLV